jgi:hypothetical protein
MNMKEYEVNVKEHEVKDPWMCHWQLNCFEKTYTLDIGILFMTS